MTMRTNTLILASAFLMPLLFSSTGFADVTIGASPAFLDVDLAAGKTTAQTVLLFNSGKDPVTVHGYSWDWWHDETNGKKFGPPGSFPNSAAPWITFVPETVTVSPGKAVNVTVTIATPAGATGGHYAVAWFEATPKSSKTGKELQVGARLGVLIMTGVKGASHPKVDVEQFTVTPPTATKPFTADIKLKNTGDVHVFPKGTLVILDGANKLIGHVGFEKRRMLPSSKSDAKVKWAGELKPGTYQAVLTIDYGDAGATVKTAAFTVGGDPSKTAQTK